MGGEFLKLIAFFVGYAKGKNMFKPNIPFISDFSYDDIDERYMGCLFPVLKKN